MNSTQLIFVYNANSGMVNTIFDMAHKLFKPDTYQCQLCTLTHGALQEHHKWKEFHNVARIDIDFYHKDEYEKKFSQTFSYPVILHKQHDQLHIFIDSETINSYNKTEALIQALRDKLNIENTHA